MGLVFSGTHIPWQCLPAKRLLTMLWYVRWIYAYLVTFCTVAFRIFL